MAHALSHNASIQAICDKNSRLWHILRAATGVSCQRNAGNVPQASMLVRPAQRTCLGVHLRQAIVTHAPQPHILVRTSKRRVQALGNAHPAGEKRRRRPKNESAANHFGERCRFCFVQTHLEVYADFSWQPACPSTPRQAARARCTCEPDTPGRARRATWHPSRRASSS